MTPAQATHEELVVGGLHSPLLQAGPSDATEAVVFVHGNPGSSRDWSDLLPAVGEFGRALAFDMPGFGRADKPRDFPYTVDGYAHFLDNALSQLGVNRSHLVLHDFGGMWGLAWALERPDSFASVVLFNTGLMLGYRWHTLARIWRTPILGELFNGMTTRPAFRLLINRGNPRPLPREFVDRMYDEFDRGTKRAVLDLYRATDDPAGLAARSAPRLRELDRPALVVWGKHDPYLGVELVERQREAFPHAETVVLDESGHWAFADDPGRVADAVLPFLRRQLAQSARLSA